MEKTTIETFIKKYNLNGLVEQVRWVVKDKTLRVTAITPDKKFLDSVTLKSFNALPDSVIGIIGTVTLKQLLGALEKDVTLTLVPADDDPNRIISLIIDDGKSEVQHMCGGLEAIANEPVIKKLPTEYDIEIVLTNEFKERFLNAKAALSDQKLFTVLNNKKKKCLELVVGYNRNVSNRISVPITVSTTSKSTTIKEPISFNSSNLKEILSANSESSDPILKISELGMATIEFDTPEFQSKYYMIKIDIED